MPDILLNSLEVVSYVAIGGIIVAGILAAIITRPERWEVLSFISLILFAAGMTAAWLLVG